MVSESLLQILQLVLRERFKIGDCSTQILKFVFYGIKYYFVVHKLILYEDTLSIATIILNLMLHRNLRISLKSVQ